MKTVLLCGCGNIGFRHLQAMAQMPNAASITIVEPNTQGHARIAAFVGTVGNGHQFTLLDALPSTPARFDLVVIATSADVRRVAYNAIVANHEVGVMILEKVLFQSVADIDAVMNDLSARGIAAYVNCPRRVFPGYQDLRGSLSGPVDIAVTGAAFGLASNGIHLLDLAEYLNGAPLVSLDVTGLQPGSVPAKRADCVEVFGHVSGALANGARIDITCDDRPEMALELTISGSDSKVVINELSRTISFAGESKPFATKFVSETWEIYDQALSHGSTNLTPYQDSAGQHRLFLAAMLQHLGLEADAACPIS